jgi:hypothetical protein
VGKSRSCEPIEKTEKVERFSSYNFFRDSLRVKSIFSSKQQQLAMPATMLTEEEKKSRTRRRLIIDSIAILVIVGLAYAIYFKKKRGSTASIKIPNAL